MVVWFGFCFIFVVSSSAYPRPRKKKKSAKVVLKDVIFARWILTGLSFLLRWPGALLSGGGHFNMPRCEVDIKTTISASLN